MESHLGRYVEENRRKSGLSRQKLAGLTGYKNLNKGARRIEQLEKEGICDPNLFQRIVAVLDLDPKKIEAKVESDQRDFEAYLDEPVPMEMIVRLMAAVYARHPLPEDVKTQAEAIEYAVDYAKKHHMKVCLVLSRRYSYWIDESGNGFMRQTRQESPMNAPYMRVSGSGKKFLFPFSPGIEN